MYEFKIDKKRKVFIVKGMGMYNTEELGDFVDDYKNNIQSIDSKNFNLVLDTTSLKTSHQEALSCMNQIMQMYFETPFKDRYYLKPSSQIAANQLKRITDMSNFKSLHVINSIDEIAA